MKKRQLGFCKESEWFYKVFAQENQVDYLQLCLLDLLRQAGGSMTWKVLYSQLPYSSVAVRATAKELESQDLVVVGLDCLTLTDLAEFTVDEILDDLHKRMDDALNVQDEYIPDLMA